MNPGGDMHGLAMQRTAPMTRKERSELQRFREAIGEISIPTICAALSDIGPHLARELRERKAGSPEAGELLNWTIQEFAEGPAGRPGVAPNDLHALLLTGRAQIFGTIGQGKRAGYSPDVAVAIGLLWAVSKTYPLEPALRTRLAAVALTPERVGAAMAGKPMTLLLSPRGAALLPAARAKELDKHLPEWVFRLDVGPLVQLVMRGLAVAIARRQAR